jgi:hypothetical protein
VFSFSRPLQLGLQATYGEFFEYQENATTAPVEAAGQYNYQTGVASALPQLRANLRMSWNKGYHAVIGTARYVDSLPYGDSPQYTFMDAITNTTPRGCSGRITRSDGTRDYGTPTTKLLVEDN